jgi:hypothetical protein
MCRSDQVDVSYSVVSAYCDILQQKQGPPLSLYSLCVRVVDPITQQLKVSASPILYLSTVAASAVQVGVTLTTRMTGGRFHAASLFH